MATKHVSIPSISTRGGHVEFSLDFDDRYVVVKLAVGGEVTSLPFDMEEFTQLIQVTGTELRNA